MHTIRLSALVVVFSAGSCLAQNVGIAALTPGVVTDYAGYATTKGCTGVTASPYDGCPPADIAISNIHAEVFDSAGNLYIADGGSHRVRRISAAGVTSTFAGNGTAPTTPASASPYGAPVSGVASSAIGDGGPATSAVIAQPEALAVDSYGNVYIADYIINRVRIVYEGGTTAANLIALENPGVTAKVGYIYTIAGTGNYVSTISTPNGPYSYPSSANSYLSATTTPTFEQAVGDGGLAINANFGNSNLNSASSSTSTNVASSNGMNGVAVDTNGNVYIADGVNDIVRVVNATTGIISIFAGEPNVSGTPTNGSTPTAAPIGVQRGIVTDAANDLFFIGSNILMINGPTTTASTPGLGFGYAPGVFHIIAGGGGTSGYAGAYNTLGILSRFGSPRQITVDAAGDLYSNDNTYDRITKLDVNDIITLVAGNSAQSGTTFTNANPPVGLGGPATSAELGAPISAAVNPLTGDLYVADPTNNIVYDVSASSSALVFGSQSTYVSSAAQNVIVSNVSTGVLHLSALAFGAATPFFQVPSGKTDCTASTVLPAGQSCYISVVFTPTAVGAVTGTITVTDDSAGIPGTTQTVSLSGTGTTTNSATVLTTPTTTVTVGASVTLTATVKSSTGTPSVFPSGTVTFLSGGTPIRTGTLNASGVATATVTLPLGGSSLTASYPGDSVFNSSTSSALVVTGVITAATSTALSGTSQTIISGTTETFTATVTSASGTPTGTVTFYNGTTALSPVSPLSNGVATYTTTTLASGYNAISAVYAGNATYTTSTSPTLGVQVGASSEPVAALIPGIVNSFAGTAGTSGSTGDAGAASAALLNGPTHVAFDAAGDLYVSDSGNNTIRKITATSGVIMTSSVISLLAGSEGVGGATVGSGTASRFQSPQGIAFDSSGNLYIADSLNNAIRKITATSGTITSSSTVTSIAGTQTQLGAYTGAAFSAGYTGDGAAATSATLNAPRDVAVDRLGNIFIADYGNNVVRMINGTGTSATQPGLGNGYAAGVIHTVAGSGRVTSSAYPIGDGGAATAATFNQIGGIAVDLNGNLYISDQGNHVVRRVAASSGTIATIAGTAGVSGYSGDGAAATVAQLSKPAALSLDVAGDLYIADAGAFVVREVNTAGTILTVAGSGTQGTSGNAGPSTSATFQTPVQAVPDVLGNLYIVDSTANTIRQINGSASALNFPTQPQSTTSAPQTVLVSNTGGSALTLSALTPAASVFTQTTTGTGNCTSTSVIAAGANCAITVTATSPNVTVDTTSTGTISLTDTSLNKPTSQQSIALSVTTDYVLSQNITFTAVGPVTYGVTPITLQASASSNLPVTFKVLSGPGSITGNVLTVTGAGSIAVLASQAGQSLVYFPTTAQQTITVNPATLTVTANNLSQSTGITIQALTYTITGFVNGDTQASATTGAPALTTTATTASPSGNYPINVAQGTLASNINSSGSANYTFSLVNGTLTLAGAPQFITFNALSPVNYSSTPIALTATSTSGLTVTYNVVSGPAAVSGNLLTTTGSGTVIVQANQAGNYNVTTNPSGYGVAVPIQQTLTVNPAPLSVAVNSVSRAYETPNPAFSSTITGTVGADVITVGYTTAATISSVPGPYTVTPVVSGTNIASYNVITTSGTLTITQATPVITLSTSASSIVYGGSITLTATVSSLAGVTPTGTVNFYAGTTLLSTTPVNLIGGTARFPTTGVPAGLQSITAVYSGDSNYATVTSSGTPVNVQASTSMTVTSSTTSINLGSPVTFTATILSSVTSNAAPTGSVAFYLNTITKTGNVVTTVSVSLGSSAVGAGGVATLSTSALPLSVIPTFSTGQVRTSCNNPFGTLSLSTVSSFLPYCVTAVYTGDALFLPVTITPTVPSATTVEPFASITVTPQFSNYIEVHSPTSGTITANNEGTLTNSGTTTTFASPGTVTVTSGQSVQLQGTLIGFNNYTQPVTFTCAGMPQYATCGFATNPLAPTSSGAPYYIYMSTAQVKTSSVGDSFPVSGHGGGRGIALAGALLGLGCFLRRRRWFAKLNLLTPRLSILLVLIASLAAFSGAVGCGSGEPLTSELTSVPTGNNSITITATNGTSTYITTFTLTVQ